jgi:hypothetical protein
MEGGEVMTLFCPGCSRPTALCWCDVEHRGSRAPEGHVALDPLFHEAAAKGFEPLGEDEKAALREKLETMGSVIYGGRGQK